jgi:hypothetical protein
MPPRGYNIYIEGNTSSRKKGSKTMSKKRFQKLVRAYFTALNEHGKSVGLASMDMKTLYRWTDEHTNPLEWCEKNRAEWWENVSKGNNLGVGVKTR